jgi:hypothetical protein
MLCWRHVYPYVVQVGNLFYVSGAYHSIGEMMGTNIDIKSVPPSEPSPGWPRLINDLWSAIGSFGDATLDTSHVIDTFDLKMLGMDECLQQRRI